MAAEGYGFFDFALQAATGAGGHLDGQGHALGGLVALVGLLQQLVERGVENDVREPRFEYAVRVGETSSESRSQCQ